VNPCFLIKTILVMGLSTFRRGTLLLGAIFMFALLQAQNLPSKDTLMKQLVTANKYFMDKWPDPGADIVTDKVRPSNLWTRAAYYEGLMALYDIQPDSAYFQYAIDWGRSHDWRPTYGSLFTRDADHQCCGQTYVELYQLNPDSSDWIAPITQCIGNIVEDQRVDDWSWVDAVQMAMPLYAKLGVVHRDTSYFRKMHEMYMYTKTRHGDNGLYNTEDHLWYRDKDFDPPYVTPGGEDCYWSRGNGWVFAALVRVLDVVPDTLEYRVEYLTTFNEMAGALIAVQREDGFWNASLADPEHYGGKETSGTAFFTYGLAWGINNGILDSAVYMPHLVKAWNGLAYEALHTDGFLGYVQGTGKQPSDGYPFTYDKPANFEDYGLGAFLLAGSETWKLAPDTGSMPAFSYPQDPVGSGSSGNRSGNHRAISLYPNPAGENSNLQFESEYSGEMDLYILNALGEVVEIHRRAILPGQNRIDMDLRYLPEGMYMAILDFGASRETLRFLKSP
jgi:unsaturated rhamnogalacturonyl hydrolase